MPIPIELLQAAFATLSTTTLRRAAQHNGIPGHAKLAPEKLVQKLGSDDGLQLQSFSSKLTLTELKRMATVFGIDFQKKGQSQLSYAVWSYLSKYDEIQQQGEVKTLDDALARETLSQRFEAVRERIEAKVTDEAAYKRLRHEEKVFWQVSILISEIFNGGIEQYLTNPSGDYAQETIEYLKEIRATKAHRLLSAVASKFPKGIIPKNEEKRCDYLDDYQNESDDAEDFLCDVDSDLEDCLERLEELAVAYVRKNRKGLE